MNKTIVEKIVATMLTGLVLLFLSGCAGSYSGYQNDSGKAYYDQYIERPGYFDFGKPVIFVPNENTDQNKPQ